MEDMMNLKSQLLILMTPRLSAHESGNHFCRARLIPSPRLLFLMRAIAMLDHSQFGRGARLIGTCFYSGMPSFARPLVLYVCLLLAGSSPVSGQVPDLNGSWTVTQDMYLTLTIDGESETEHTKDTGVVTLTQSGTTVTYYLTVTDPVTGETYSMKRVGTIQGNTVTFTGNAAMPAEGISYTKNSFVATGTIQGKRIDLTATVDVAFTYMGLYGTIKGNGTIVMISNAPSPAPVISSISPTTGTAGTSLANFTIYGSNFTATSTLSFSGSGIAVSSYSTRTASQMTAGISIASSASAGKRNVIVTNPDGQSATLANAFSVVSGCAAPQISAQPGTRTISFGGVASLSVTAAGTEPLRYQWYEGSQGNTAKPVGANSAQFTSPQLTSSTSYWTRVSNACGQADSQTVIITVGPAPLSEITLSPPAGGSVSTSTYDSTGELIAGYALARVGSGSAPYGTAVFSYRQNGVVVSEVGVPASPPTTNARIFVDYRAQVNAVPGRSSAGIIDLNTGIAVVNPNSSTANVTYTLRNKDGQPVALGHGTIAAGRHFARFIDQLRDLASDFILPANFQSVIQFGSLELTSDQPLSVLALRGTMNQRSEFLMTTTLVADLTQSVSYDPLYFPQLADGGGYTTSLLLLNTSNRTESGTLQILDKSGAPVIVNQVGGTADSSFRYSIPAGGAFRFQTDGFSANTKTGWVRLTPDSMNPTPVGSGVFGYNPGAVLVSESGVPAASTTTHARVYVDLSKNHNTGLAIANPNSFAISIVVRGYQTNGTTAVGTTQGPLSLVAGGYDAKFVDQLISGLPAGFTGVLDISSSAPFAALTLRSLVNGRNEFLMTTFPVADANRIAPSPIIFPQIADGGGYLTEFILLGTGGASSTILNIYGDDGKPLPLISGKTNAPLFSQSPVTVHVWQISSFRHADDFVLAENSPVAAIRFWAIGNSSFASAFSGTLSWAIYSDNASVPGVVLASGIGNMIKVSDTGVPNFFGNRYAVTFNLVSPVSLSANTRYWLEIHEGPTLTTNDGTEILWVSGTGSVGCFAECQLGGPWWQRCVNNVINDEQLAFELFSTPQ
jgi:hypothetical protein